MRISSFLSLGVLATGALSQNMDKKHMKQEYVEKICRDTVHNMEQPFLYILAWDLWAFPNRGKSSDPWEIRSKGGVYITKRDCTLVGTSMWVGDSTRINTDFDGDLDRDERLSVWIEAVKTSTDAPGTPKNVEYEHDGVQAAGDQTQSQFNCGGIYTIPVFGRASFWRICTFTPVCDDCP